MEENNLVTVDSLVRRIELFIEEKDWVKGVEYCNRVLDIEPENAKAYLLLLLCNHKSNSLDDLAKNRENVYEEPAYKNAYKFGDAEQKRLLDEYMNSIKDAEKEEKYQLVKDKMSFAKSKNEIDVLIKKIEELGSYKDSIELLEQCQARYKEAEEAELNSTYNDACRNIYKHEVDEVKKAKRLFESVKSYKDSEDKIKECDERIQNLEKEKQAEKKRFKKIAIATVVVILLMIFAAAIDLVHIISPVFKSQEEMVTFLERSYWKQDDLDTIYGFANGEIHYYRDDRKHYTRKYTITSYRAGTFSDGIYDYVVSVKTDSWKGKSATKQFYRIEHSDLVDNAYSVEETERLDAKEKSSKSSKSSNSSYSSSSSSLSSDEKSWCWVVAKDYVKAQLKSPSSAKFPSITSSDIKYTKSGSTYTVSAYVDAENSYGASIRTYFTVVIEKSGENYRAVSCSFN